MSSKTMSNDCHRRMSTKCHRQRSSKNRLLVIKSMLILLTLLIIGNEFQQYQCKKLSKFKMMKKLMKAKVIIKPLIKSGLIRPPTFHVVVPMMAQSAIRSLTEAATSGVISASSGSAAAGITSSLINSLNIGAGGESSGGAAGIRQKNLPSFARGKGQNFKGQGFAIKTSMEGGAGDQETTEYIVDLEQFQKNIQNLPEMYRSLLRNLLSSSSSKGGNDGGQDAPPSIEVSEDELMKLQQALSNCQQRKLFSKNIFRNFQGKQSTAMNNRCSYPITLQCRSMNDCGFSTSSDGENEILSPATAPSVYIDHEVELINPTTNQQEMVGASGGYGGAAVDHIRGYGSGYGGGSGEEFTPLITKHHHQPESYEIIESRHRNNNGEYYNGNYNHQNHRKLLTAAPHNVAQRNQNLAQQYFGHNNYNPNNNQLINHNSHNNQPQQQLNNGSSANRQY